MDGLIGKEFGPYTIIDRLGEGGMAEVYRAHQRTLNRNVAIKVLKGELARDKDSITRFQREALAVAKLSHPNILHVHDAGMLEGVYYIVMDYAEGGSLKDVLARGPMAPDRAVSITTQLADALDHAHRHGLVHRDVKPSNVLLSSEGRPLLTDFGIAKALDAGTHLTQTGTSIGTPEYMAPEQAQGQTIDARTDIYALGIVLYELLTGMAPFSAPTPVAALYKQINEPPPPLRQVNVNIPDWLNGAVMKALAKRPADRYQHASDFAQALRQGPAIAPAASAGRAPARRSAPASTLEAAGGQGATLLDAAPPRKSPIPLLLGAIVVLLLVLLAGGLYLVLRSGGGGQVAGATPTIASPTENPLPTSTQEPTDSTVSGTAVAVPTDSEPPTPIVLVVTATAMPTTPLVATLESTTAAVAVPSVAAPTLAPTTQPATGSTEPGGIVDFEGFGTWKRGDQLNGTLTQSSAQVHQGSSAARLDYQFQSRDNDYVVFQQSHAMDGSPQRITAWVYGDGEGHFFNVWIKEQSGQIWQVPLGRVTHTGWKQMEGAIDAGQDWPWTHIDGPNNGSVDYPVSFNALILDDTPDTYIGSGTIYIDDLRTDTGSASPGSGVTPTVPVSVPPEPTTPSVTSVSGRIAYSVGGDLYIVNAQTGKETVAPLPGMRQPDFRADGDVVLANGEGKGKDSLWTINANSGAFMRQQSPFTDDLNPFWSPDGSRFVYASFHHGLGRYQMLYTQGLDSKKKPPEVTLHFNGQQIRGEFPIWLHDDWIAFTACDYWPGGTGGSNCGIFRMPSWSGEPHRVVPGSLAMRPTDNHSNQLLYMSQDSGNWEVYLVPSQGGSSINLSDSASSQDGLATFSPDGKTVAFVSNRGGGWAIWAVKPNGTGLTKLFNLPSKLTGTWTEESISWAP